MYKHELKSHERVFHKHYKTLSPRTKTGKIRALRHSRFNVILHVIKHEPYKDIPKTLETEGGRHVYIGVWLVIPKSLRYLFHGSGSKHRHMLLMAYLHVFLSVCKYVRRSVCGYAYYFHTDQVLSKYMNV